METKFYVAQRNGALGMTYGTVFASPLVSQDARDAFAQGDIREATDEESAPFRQWAAAQEAAKADEPADDAKPKAKRGRKAAAEVDTEADIDASAPVSETDDTPSGDAPEADIEADIEADNPAAIATAMTEEEVVAAGTGNW